MTTKGKAKYEMYRMLADKRGWSDYRTSKETKIAQETLSSWKNGKYVPKTDKLQILADEFGVPIDFFYGDAPKSIKVDTTHHVDKTMMVYEVAAGTARCPVVEDHAQEDGHFAKVVGDSMYPTLHDGDIVRIIETSKVEPTDIALVKVNGDENTLKHIEMTPDGVWVRGENQDVFEDRFFTIEEVLTLPVQIVGKAVEIVSRKL